MKGLLRRLSTGLIPADERELVLRELDDLAEARARRRGGAHDSGIWYAGQCVRFGLGLRLERLRDAAGAMGGLLHDLGFGLRSLLRRPGYLAASVLTLGIGTGGVAIVYGAADWVLLRDVPGVGSPKTLVQLRLESADEAWGGLSWGVMQPDVERLRERLSTLAGLEASTANPVHFTSPGGVPSRVEAEMVTPGFFELLELSPAAGRFFRPEEHEGAGPAEAVIGYDLARRHWSGPRGALGVEVVVNGRPFRVIGVAPKGFRGAELPGEAQLWFPSTAFGTLRPNDAETGIDGAVQLWDLMVGRRADGVDVRAVGAQADRVLGELQDELSGQNHSFLPSHFVLRAHSGIGLDPWIRPRVARTLGILGAASLSLLLLAVANVANLGLTRAASVRKATAVRRALGASRSRVSRGPLLEGLIVGGLGAAVGIALLLLAREYFAEAQLSSRGASLAGMTFGIRVVLLVFSTSLAAGFLSGVVPAWTVRNERALDSLTGGRRGGKGATRARAFLVVGQVALSGALLVGTGLFVQTASNLDRVDLGVARDAYTFSVDAGLDGRDEEAALATIADIQVRSRTRFGEGVGVVFPHPVGQRYVTSSVSRPGASREESGFGAAFWTSGNGLFRALGLRFVAGTGYEQDVGVPSAVERPVVITESMAKAAFPELQPGAVVGRSVVINGGEEEHTVAGVLADARILNPQSEPRPIVFLPFSLDWSGGRAAYYVRAEEPVGVVGAASAELVRDVDSGLPVFETGTVQDRVDEILTEQRVVARLATGLGAVGLTLVALGLYGVLSYVVTERTREIGVRSALGAGRGTIRGEVLRRGVSLVGLGLVVGMPFTAWATRFIESRLYGVDRLDPATFFAGAAGLLLVALLASWVPARRATAVSPVEALREE